MPKQYVPFWASFGAALPRLVRRVPAYRLHKNSGHAVVTLNGFDHYLGAHGSKESRRQYDRLIAEWLSAGRHFARPTAEPLPAGVSVDEIVLAFWRHAEGYYVSPPTGEPTSELDHFRQALCRLRRLYGDTPANDFGPKSLAAVREAMVAGGWSRGHVNQQVRRLVMVFKYAASQELVPAAVHAQLKTLAGGLPHGCRPDGQCDHPVQFAHHGRLRSAHQVRGKVVPMCVRRDPLLDGCLACCGGHLASERRRVGRLAGLAPVRPQPRHHAGEQELPPPAAQRVWRLVFLTGTDDGVSVATLDGLDVHRADTAAWTSSRSRRGV